MNTKNPPSYSKLKKLIYGDSKSRKYQNTQIKVFSPKTVISPTPLYTKLKILSCPIQHWNRSVTVMMRIGRRVIGRSEIINPARTLAKPVIEWLIRESVIISNHHFTIRTRFTLFFCLLELFPIFNLNFKLSLPYVYIKNRLIGARVNWKIDSDGSISCQKWSVM